MTGRNRIKKLNTIMLRIRANYIYLDLSDIVILNLICYLSE